MNNNSSGSKPAADRSIVSAIAMLVGALLVLFSLFSVISTITGWKLEVKGAPLPNDWYSTIALICVSAIFWAIWALLTLVKPVQQFGRKHPWIMALFVVVGLVGAIVGITIWDNADIKARNEQRAAEQTADSLDRVQESATYFEGKEIPYRLAVFNPVASKVEVLVDGQVAGEIAPYEALELQLPWHPTTVSLRNGSEQLDSLRVKPDSTKGKDPAQLLVYCPLKQLNIWLFDYDGAYQDGKLKQDPDFKPEYLTSIQYTDFDTVHQAGPFFVYPNQAAPATAPYHVYRFVLLPYEMEDYSDSRSLGTWIMQRIDKRAAPAPAESPTELYRLWQAE